MTDIAIRMKDELLKLDSQDRAALAHILIDSLDDEDEKDIEEAWYDGLLRRNALFELGMSVGIPADQAFQALREATAT